MRVQCRGQNEGSTGAGKKSHNWEGKMLSSLSVLLGHGDDVSIDRAPHETGGWKLDVKSQEPIAGQLTVSEQGGIVSSVL